MSLSGQRSRYCTASMPEQDRQRHGDQRGEEGEEQRVAEPVADLLADRVAAGPGGAEVAVHRAAEPREVALGPRPVEAELGADVRHRLGRRRLAEVGRWRSRRAAPRCRRRSSATRPAAGRATGRAGAGSAGAAAGGAPGADAAAPARPCRRPPRRSSAGEPDARGDVAVRGVVADVVDEAHHGAWSRRSGSR